MKKFLSLLLVSVMMVSCFSAFAEEESETTDIYFDEAAIENLEGDFVTLEDLGFDFEFFLPAFLTRADVTDDMASQGIIDLYVNEDMTRIMSAGFVEKLEVNGIAAETMDDVAAAYAAVGYSFMPVYVNDYEAALYTSEELGVNGVLFLLEDNSVLSFNFTPASDEEYAAAAQIIVSSMSFFDAEEGEEVSE